jgi:histidyl-tRNA synthetase
VPHFQTSPGTRDILPPEAERWRRFVDEFADVVSLAGYSPVMVPIFEDIGVFRRIGEATDVVTKEMYDFEDKGGRHVALRPEQTAGVCRAFAQHRPPVPWKVWYAGPNFRYEKAQAGRYRQFDQVGVEVLGAADPHVDAEVIGLAARFYERLGLRRVRLHVNSLGESSERASYVEALHGHLTARADALSEEARATLVRNPLRVLDSKREEDRAVVADAPRIGEFLGPQSRAHFDAVLAALDRDGIRYRVSEHLVRGLDYYRRTTFEFSSEALEGAQNAVGGGGRYDTLVEELGGPPTDGVGFALGVDRTLLACDAEGVFAAPSRRTDVFVVDTTGGAEAAELVGKLRDAGVVTERAFDGRSMKSQMKSADRSGALVAVIIGDEELAAGTCTVRRLDRSEQVTVARADVISHLRSVLAEDQDTR